MRSFFANVEVKPLVAGLSAPLWTRWLLKVGARFCVLPHCRQKGRRLASASGWDALKLKQTGVMRSLPFPRTVAPIQLPIFDSLSGISSEC